MKMRLRGNSIRLRLTRSEVARLLETGRVEERVEFGAGAALTYAIESREGADAAFATLEPHRVTVVVPSGVARRFAESEDVGFHGSQGALKLLVEKDWQCLAPREEDADAFPHPGASAK
jgi:hypothetical protein